MNKHIWLIKMAHEEGITHEEMESRIQQSVESIFRFEDLMVKTMIVAMIIFTVYVMTLLPR